MEEEAVKAFFMETRRAGLRFQKLGKVLEEEKQKAYSVRGVNFHERVQENSSHDVADKVERLETIKRAFLEAYIVMCDRHSRAYELLQLDPYNARRAILIERFLLRRPWDEVAKDMGLSRGSVFRLAREAYRAIGNSSQAVGILERP